MSIVASSWSKFSFQGAAASLTGKFLFPPNVAPGEMLCAGSRTGSDSCYQTGPKVEYIRGNPESFEVANYEPGCRKKLILQKGPDLFSLP